MIQLFQINSNNKQLNDKNLTISLFLGDFIETILENFNVMKFVFICGHFYITIT
jgi:hypothetical protein